MILLNPEKSIGNEEVLYLIHLIVENLSSPVRMLTFPGIRIFIQGLSVKIRQSMGISGKMSRYPVQDYANLIFMKVINQIHKVLRASVSGGRCIIARYLIPPGTVKGMFRNPHQLHMSIPHLLHIVCQTVGQLPVAVKSVLIRSMRMLFPGTRMYLIDRHRRFLWIPLLPLLHPDTVAPSKTADIRNLRGRSRALLRFKCIGVSLVEQSVIRCLNQIFIKTSHLHIRNKQFIDPKGLQAFHLMAFLVPSVKLPNDMHAMGMGRPDSKMYAFLSLMLCRVGTQLPKNIVVIPLAKQILIHICHKAGRNRRLPFPFRLYFPFLFLRFSHNTHSCMILNTALPPAGISK